MSPQLTVIICTHNPRQDYLLRVVDALQQQTLSPENWQLLVIDNASTPPLATWLHLHWHPYGRVIAEPRLGLTLARRRGFLESQTPLLVYVDDDNVLAPDYLEQVCTAFEQYPNLGVVAGKALPEFESPPSAWVQDFYTILALRNFGEAAKITAGQTATPCQHYPACAPAGAGMALRKDAFARYWHAVGHDEARLALGRTGQSLVSGEDNDIVLTLLNQGWAVGYLPQLQLTHLISANRLTPDYLARLNFAACQSWVQVLNVHGIRLWPAIPRWSLQLRQAKAWLRLRPWQSPSAYIRWQGACGILAGQASLTHPAQRTPLPGGDEVSGNGGESYLTSHFPL